MSNLVTIEDNDILVVETPVETVLQVCGQQGPPGPGIAQSAFVFNPNGSLSPSNVTPIIDFAFRLDEDGNLTPLES